MKRKAPRRFVCPDGRMGVYFGTTDLSVFEDRGSCTGLPGEIKGKVKWLDAEFDLEVDFTWEQPGY